MNDLELRVYNHLKLKCSKYVKLNSLTYIDNKSTKWCNICKIRIHPKNISGKCEMHSLKFLIVFDFTNLYRLAMSKKLPISNYKKISLKKIAKLQEIYSKKISNLTIGELIPDDGNIGYILCVDISFPTEFYEHYSKISICPVKMDIISSMLNNTQRR